MPTDTHDEVFARATDAYLRRALGLAFYLLGSGEEAEDAVQEAMSQAWKHRRSLRNPGSYDSWFDRILVNSCRARLRRRRRVREVDLSIAEQREANDEIGSMVSRDAIARALFDLDLDQRTVVVLHYWRDMPLEQIADRLGWRLGTVKSRLHRALAAIRKNLSDDGGEMLQ